MSARLRLRSIFRRDRAALNRGAQSRLRVMMIVLRTAHHPMRLADAVRRELHDIDPMLPVLHVNTAGEQLDGVIAQDRLLAALSSGFGISALAVACAGVFGLLSYAVARRTSEIGALAAFFPARRAARIEPMTALRRE